LLIYLGILGVLAGLFVLVIPALVHQGGALVRGLPQVYASLVASLEKNPNEVIRTLPQRLPTGDQLANQLQAVSGAVLPGALGIGVGVLAFLTQILSIVVLSIYLTLDQSRLERFWLSLAPAARRPELLAIWREIESCLGGYVRGELLMMTSIGVLASLGYLLIGLPYPLALGVLAGLLEFVPMVGPSLGAIPAIVVALSISPQAALLVVVYSIVIQVGENNILVTRLMGRSVGVSPVIVILAVFAFGLGVLVLASLLLTAGVSAVGSFLGSTLPGSETVWRLADFGLSFGLATLLVASIFKILPDVRIPWADVWPGAILTALLIDVAQGGARRDHSPGKSRPGVWRSGSPGHYPGVS
jgi:predicted PurR-regulated permease PerM